MGRRAFSLEAGGPKRLSVSWNLLRTQYEVQLDALPSVTIAGSEVRRGREVELADGSLVMVRFSSGVVASGLEVSRNGVPLPGSAHDPATMVTGAANTVRFLAAAHLILGAAFQLDSGRFHELAPELLGLGAVFSVLGVFTRRRSQAALVTAMVVYAVAGALALFSGMQGGQVPALGIAIRVYFLYRMSRGVVGLRALRVVEAQRSSAS